MCLSVIFFLILFCTVRGDQIWSQRAVEALEDKGTRDFKECVRRFISVFLFFFFGGGGVVISQQMSHSSRC